MTTTAQDLFGDAGPCAGGSMGALMRAHGWDASPLGAPSGWPLPLRTLVGVMLGAKQPMFVAWGRDRSMLYNDGYAALLGRKHPSALGRPFFEVWPDVLDDIGPLVDRVFAGTPVHMEDIELRINRNGYEEEAHFAFSYTPVRDEAGVVAGLFCACTETTTQVLAERRRVVEGERLRQFFHQAPGFMCVLRGPDHVFEMTNAAFDTLTGRVDMAGKPVRKALPEVEGQGFFEMLDGVFASNTPHVGRGVPIWFQAHAGAPWQQRHVDFIYQPITDAEGTVTGIFVEGSDVTEAHGTQAALRAERDRCQAILESITEGFVLLDPEFRVVQINAEALRIDGRSAAEVVGRTHWELWPGTENSEPGLSYKHAMARREAVAMVHNHVFPDGRSVWVDLRAYPSGDGLAVFYRDVTERKHNELRQQQSEARFRGITDSIDHMVWSALPDGRHDFYNQRWYDYTGLPQGSFGGEAWSDLLHPDDRSRAWDAWRRCLSAGEPYHIEYRLRHHTGQHRWVLARAQPVRDEHGTITRWYGTCTDIQEIVEARDVLARSREHLEQLVAERTAALVQANARLQAEAQERGRVEDQLRQSQKMEAVGQLTGGIAHDFNNMLQAVSGALQVMQRRVEQGRPEEAGRYVAMAEQGVSRAALLTQRLLAFARRQTLDPRPVVLDTLLHGMADLVTRTVGPGVEVRAELGDGGFAVRCDANQLENAVLNLAINARDAMPHGGRLTIRTTEVRLEPADVAGYDNLPAGSYVELAVADTGEGMPPDVAARAFEPFFTTKPLGQGTGLGLSQLYGFVRQSDGMVRLDSTPGQGTTVRILLPRHRAEPEADGPTPSGAGAGPAGGGTVLVVEDEAAIRSLLTEALRERGYAVHEAADGPAGLRLLQSGAAVDLLVTDVGLPGLNGRQLADAGRVMRPGMKVLFITGYNHGMDEDGVLEPGMELITKPFVLDELAGRVQAMLG